MRVLYLLLFLPVLLVSVALMAMWLSLPGPWPPIIAGLTALAYLFGIAVFVIRRVLGAGRLWNLRE